MDDVKDGDIVIFAFGEIDCRCHIKKQMERQGAEAEVVIEKLVLSYIDAIQEIMRPYPKCTVFVQSITPAVRKTSTTENPMYPFVGSDAERRSYVKIFNEICQREVVSRFKFPEGRIHFLDVWKPYADKDGFLRGDMSDGHVHIQNPDYTVQSEKLDYETETDISWFYGPTTITSDQAVIYCEKGWHNKQTDEARFSRNAKVTSGSKVLIGDSLYYQRGRGYGQGFGNIQIHDSTEKITLLGQYAETWKDLNLYMVTGDAQMIQAFDSDSLFLHGDTLKGWEDTLGYRVVQCWNHVKFFKPDLQGACDSLFYTERDSLMRMFFTPVIWSDSSQMTGTYIHLKMDRGTLYHFDLLQKALLIAQDDTIRFNQLSGQNMRGFFHENDLVRLHVMEKGKLIYYPREEDGSLMGANTLSCRNITLSMANRQIQRISCQQKADGTLHPWETFTGPERLLDGFIWHVTDRPRKPVDIFIHRKGR